MINSFSIFRGAGFNLNRCALLYSWHKHLGTIRIGPIYEYSVSQVAERELIVGGFLRISLLCNNLLQSHYCTRFEILATSSVPSRKISSVVPYSKSNCVFSVWMTFLFSQMENYKISKVPQEILKRVCHLYNKLHWNWKQNGWCLHKEQISRNLKVSDNRDTKGI